MAYSEDQIQRRLQLGEDSRWEFKQIAFAGSKPTSPRRDDLADELAAFANGSGGAMLCSVSDEGEVLDLSSAQLKALAAHFTEIARDTVKPALFIETHLMQVAGGKRLMLVEIPKDDAQHDSPGGAYIRIGPAKRRMTSDERLRLAQRRAQARYLWFDKQPVPNTGFGALDERLWKPLLSAEGAADPEAALEKMALLIDDDAGVRRATVAGVLACARAPESYLPGASITATHYRGTDRASAQTDAQEITGPLDQQIAAAVAFATRNMQVSARKTPAREELPQYSDQAIFEAVVNAVAHRDYSVQGSRIRLSMFADRLELQSPGALPNNLTLEQMGARQSTRNEALAALLGRMPVRGLRGSGSRRYFMERRGDGVPIIRRATFELSGKHPEYRLIDDAELCLVIPAAAQEASAGKAEIVVSAEGKPVPGVHLLALFPNGAQRPATTDAGGLASIQLHTTHLPMTVFAAAPGHAAFVGKGWTPSQGALAVELQPLKNGGSQIFTEGEGQLPGLSGRLSPKRDTHDRTYLHAPSIAINKGQEQPVPFLPGEPLRLTDAQGHELTARIIDITGPAALLEYTPA